MSGLRLNRSLKRLQRTLLSQKYGVATSTLATTFKLTPFTGDQVVRWDPWLIGMSWFFKVLIPKILLIAIIWLGLTSLYVILDNYFGLTDGLINLLQWLKDS